MLSSLCLAACGERFAMRCTSCTRVQRCCRLMTRVLIVFYFRLVCRNPAATSFPVNSPIFDWCTNLRLVYQSSTGVRIFGWRTSVSPVSHYSISRPVAAIVTKLNISMTNVTKKEHCCRQAGGKGPMPATALAQATLPRQTGFHLPQEARPGFPRPGPGRFQAP
jgi:hypothetical protein